MNAGKLDAPEYIKTRHLDNWTEPGKERGSFKSLIIRQKESRLNESSIILDDNWSNYVSLRSFKDYDRYNLIFFYAGTLWFTSKDLSKVIQLLEHVAYFDCGEEFRTWTEHQKSWKPLHILLQEFLAERYNITPLFTDNSSLI